MSIVKIDGLNRADVLASLFNHAKPLGMGFLHYKPEHVMAREEAERLLQKHEQYGHHFDYIEGRLLKVVLDPEKQEFYAGSYDRDNGEGAAQTAIDELRNAQN